MVFEGIFDKQDPQDLSKKERALIERRRKLEQTRQQLDPTGSSSLESLFDFLRSSNFVPMNPFTGERFVR